MADCSEQLGAIAKGPKAATADGMSVTAQNPEAIMKTEDRLKTNTAARNSVESREREESRVQG